MMLRFTIWAEPQPKGSTQSRGFILKDKATGRARYDRHGNPVIITSTRSANPNLKGWEQLVAETANRALGALPEAERGVLQNGVFVTAAFYLPRPQRFLIEKWARPGAPVPPHETRPDLDKLARGVLDALSGVVWSNDAQVARLTAMKSYVLIRGRQPDPPHADLWIQPAPQPVATLEELLRDQPLFAEIG